MSGDWNALATAWVASQAIAGERTDEEWAPVFAVQDLAANPEELWQFILAAEHACATEQTLGMLGAGPLEDLIQNYGPAFVDRIEQRVSESPRFAELVRSVWVPAGQDPVTIRYQALGCNEVRPPA